MYGKSGLANDVVKFRTLDIGANRKLKILGFMGNIVDQWSAKVLLIESRKSSQKPLHVVVFE